MRKFLLFILFTVSVSVCSQIRVQIGDLYYNISGTTASVAPNRSYYYEDDYKIVYRCNYRKSEYSIPSSVNYNGYDYPVVSIDEGAFADQAKYFSDGSISYYNNLASPIEHVTFSNSITHIGAYAFYNRYLDEWVLPNVETIDDYAFSGSNTNSKALNAPKLKRVGNYVFADNRKLVNVNIPMLESVGNHAFANCTSLTIISAPNLITIDDCSFEGCTNLATIDLQKISAIGKNAFSNCQKLTSVIFPKTLLSMEENVFNGCSLLRELFYLSHTPPANWIVTTMTYVPDKVSYSSPKTIINNGEVIEMITYKTNDFDYAGQSPTTTWVNNVSGYDATLSFSAINKDVGTHEEWIPVTFTKGEDSFICEVIFRYSINPTALFLQANNMNREYGEDNPKFTISYSGFVNGESENVFTTNPTISTTATKTSDVGEYPITISGGKAQNYSFVYEPGVLTVTKAPLTAKVKDETRQYGKDNPTFSVSYTGLKNGETIPKWTEALKIETTATKQSDVGTYDISATGVPVNYDLPNIEKGTLTITPAPLTIKANNETRQYYSNNPDFSYTCNGFVNGDSESNLSTLPTVSTSATQTSNVGTYDITVSGAISQNYSISYTNGTLTITPRALTASVGNYGRAYNEENPSFEVVYDGFVGDENESVLSTKPTASTTATKTSDVGTYPITVAGGVADNYEFSYTNGELTINKAEQTISWEQDLSNLKVGDQVEMKAVASSGLPVTYTMDTDVAELYSAGTKTYLDCLAEGRFYIRASQSGNNNYYSSIRVTKVVAIGESGTQTTISMSGNGYSTYCNSYAMDFTNVSNLKAYIASGINPSTGVVLLTRVYKVPAGEGILLKGDAGDYEVPFTDTNVYYTNLLKGVTRATTISPTEGNYTNFILANGSHGIGFYTLSQAGEIAAGKAYLQLPTSAISSNAARGLTMRFDDEDGSTTAVEEVENGLSTADECYDLQGRRIGNSKLNKGLYIMRSADGRQQGKKLFIK